MQARGSRGTQAVPAALQTNDYLGWFWGSGHNGVGFTQVLRFQQVWRFEPPRIGMPLTMAPVLPSLPHRMELSTGLERMTVLDDGNILANLSSETARDLEGLIWVPNGPR